VPSLLPKVQTLRGFVPVDYYLPGCPPAADLIFFVLGELIAGRTLDLHSRATLG
jgi:NAD-reducing hydrogenase small subunit